MRVLRDMWLKDLGWILSRDLTPERKHTANSYTIKISMEMSK